MFPFVYLTSVCRSLQCLISALTQVGGGGLLFRFDCSVVLRGGRGAADRYCCVWGALAVFRPQWVCPRSQVSVLSRLHCSGSWMLYMERALRCVRFQFSGTPEKRGLSWACVLCLPHPSSSGSQELDRRTLPGCGAPSPLHGPSLSFLARRSDACGLCLFLGVGL